MEKSESIKNIAGAIISVMMSIKGIEKNLEVGSGGSSYKGVSDKDVKIEIGNAMEKHGLCLTPIGVSAKTQVDRWEETNQYGTKTKQSVFTEVNTRYLLMHADSGEWIVLEGYGQGVDSQDKSAGKSTTYALKYTLLYTFMVATGKIDDADNEHSDSKEVAPAQPRVASPESNPSGLVKPKETEAPTAWLNPKTQQWTEAQAYLKAGGNISAIKKKYKISADNEKALLDSINQPA